jgi:hypothetical protein
MDSLLLGGPFDGTILTRGDNPEKWTLELVGLESWSVYRRTDGVFDNRNGETVQVYQWVGSESPIREQGVEI